MRRLLAVLLALVLLAVLLATGVFVLVNVEPDAPMTERRTETPVPSVDAGTETETTTRRHADLEQADGVAELISTVEITGSVEADATGEPIVGARVELLATPPRVRSPAEGRFEGVTCMSVPGLPVPWDDLRAVAESTTDAEGAFSLVGPEPFQHSVRVSAPGYLSATRRVHDASVSVGLYAARAYRVRVLDESDRPIEGAEVLRYEGSFTDLPSGRGIADAEGWVDLDTAEEDSLLVRAEGFATQVVSDLGERLGEPITLTPAFPLAGRVVDHLGQPLGGVTLHLWSDGATLRETGVDGEFRWDHLSGTGGGFLIEAWRSGYVTQKVQGHAGDEHVEIVMEPAATIAGRVVLPDAAKNREVVVVARRGDERHYEETASDGTFRFEGLPSGEFELAAKTVNDEITRDDPPGPMAWGGTIGVRVETGAVRDDVLLRLERLPSSILRVRAVYPDGASLGAWGYEAVFDADIIGLDVIRTGEGLGDGGWTSFAVPPRTPVTIHVTSHESEAERTTSVETVTLPEDAREPFTVMVKRRIGGPVTTLTLVTRRTDGTPVPLGPDVGWYVQAAKRRWGPERIEDAAVATAQVTIPAETPSVVTAFADGCATLVFELPAFAAGPQRYECLLPPESIVTGRLVTKSGRPVSHAVITILVDLPNGQKAESIGWTTEIGADGTFSADQLPGGSAMLTVTTTDNDILAEQRIVVPSTGTADIGDIVVGALPAFEGIVLDAEGKPRGGVPIEITDTEDYVIAEGVTQHDGTFRVQTPIRGWALVSFAIDDPTLARRYQWGIGETDALGKRQTIRLLPTGDVAIRTHGAEDLSECSARLTHATETGARPRWISETEYGWSAQGIPPGRVTVTIAGHDADGENVMRRGDVDVVSGAEAEIVLRFDD